MRTRLHSRTLIQAHARALAQRCSDVEEQAKNLVVELSGGRAPFTFKGVTYPTKEMAKCIKPIKPVLVGKFHQSIVFFLRVSHI